MVHRCSISSVCDTFPPVSVLSTYSMPGTALDPEDVTLSPALWQGQRRRGRETQIHTLSMGNKPMEGKRIKEKGWLWVLGCGAGQEDSTAKLHPRRDL